MPIRLLSVTACLFCMVSYAQTDNSKPFQEAKKWFETIKVGGYVQARYNRLFETNSQLGCDQCDKSWGDGGGFFLRRIRMKFRGNVGNKVYFYIQHDFASGDYGKHFGQLKDAYFDVALDNDLEYRFRIGQSKVPFGFENMQSSQNRLPLDRNDGLNSSIKNEREVGVFFYWAPKEIRQRFSRLANTRLKGSGDYGVFGLGVFNGQTGNAPELNNELHVVGRISYPLKIGNQIIEPGLQGYTGMYQMPEENISEGTVVNETLNYKDQRAAATVVLYPQPFGVQAEYNIGRGPRFNKDTGAIEEAPLNGGYTTLTYRKELWGHEFFPFTRYHFYDGGKKFEQDARSYHVKELELGVEWQPHKNFELVAMYTISSRRYEDYMLSDNLQEGSLLRLQAQLNF